MENKFTFKSSATYYAKECLDIKNNTVREIDLEDSRFTGLIAWMETGWNDGELKIRIVDALYPETYFERDIRDITIWADLMIITWREK